ncbi:MAG: YihY/virulence factor BrkB family protein [Candidatus Nanopelagicales bacterium]
MASPDASLFDRVDSFQQSHAAVAVPVAVYKKFSEDEGGRLASLISYHAFLSVFPLLLVLTTVLSNRLVPDSELSRRIVTTAGGTFLAVGDQGAITPLQVSGWALGIGVLIGVWNGLAVCNSMQRAMNVVQEVPKTEWPGLVPRLGRNLGLILVVGLGLTLTTVALGFGTALGSGWVAVVPSYVVVFLLDLALIGLAFWIATVSAMSWRQVLPGAAIAAAAWLLLQAIGSTLLTQKVSGAQQTYGQFAVIVGLLFWFYLLAQITLYCAELNNVLARRLWPRGLRSVLSAQADTEADVRAYKSYPKRENQAQNATVRVGVEPIDHNESTANEATRN